MYAPAAVSKMPRSGAGGVALKAPSCTDAARGARSN